MAEFTQNYNLYKPNRADSDPVDTTLSANFQTIDTEMKKRETDIATVTNDLETKTSDLQSQIDSKTSTLQEQFDNAVIEGDSSLEAAQARVKEDGTSFQTLRDRLNETDTQIDRVLTKLHLNGADNYIVIDRTIEPKDAITIECNVILGESPVPNARLIQKPYTGANVTNSSFGIAFDDSGLKPKFYIQTASMGFEIVSSDPLEVGKLYQIVATWDKASGIGKLYVDGTEKAQSAPVTEDIRNDSNKKLYIGATENSTGGTSYLFKGTILKTKVWGSSLTIDQVKNGYENNLVYDSTISIPYTFTGTVAYQNYANVVTRIQAFTYESFGKDASGTYDMYFIKLGTAGKPVIMLNGSMHGTEWQGTQYMLSLMEQLRDNTFPDAAFRQKLLDNYQIVCVPVLNPYGYDRVTDIYLQYNDAARCNANGVDLNNNFDEGDQSEVETQNFIKLIQTYKPFAYLDAHMFQPDYPEGQGNNLIIGHGQPETDYIRDIISDSWTLFSGDIVTEWPPRNLPSSELSRAYVARQANPYTPFTLAYITELVRPTDINAVRVSPLTDEEIYSYGIANLYLFFKTSMDYFEYQAKGLIHQWRMQDGSSKIFDDVTKYSGVLYGVQNWEGVLTSTTSHLDKRLSTMENREPIYVVEQGSNANGNYIRYSDGTQKCWGIPFNIQADQAVGIANAVWQSATRTWTYPKPFKSGETIFVNGDVAAIGSWLTIVAAPTYQSVNVRSEAHYAMTAPYSAYLQAFGKWK